MGCESSSGGLSQPRLAVSPVLSVRVTPASAAFLERRAD